MQQAASSSSSSSSLLGAASAAMAYNRAQVLEGDHFVYEFGHNPPSQQKRQLDVLPISAYGWDSGLPPGLARLIAVNHGYVCYCLRSSGSIRILGRSVPSRGLFQRHNQRLTDIEFFSEDVNLVASVSLDGRLCVWRIVENAGSEDDFQLQQHVILAIHFEGAWKEVCPRVCWHPQSQDILLVCMSNHIFKIDVKKARTKASKLQLSEEASLSCSAADPIDGIFCIGHHDAEVTDLSVVIQDVLYVASACSDGKVRVWEDCNVNPIAVLMPHDRQPVGSVFFLTCDDQPDKTALLTSDGTNTKLKLWVPAPSSRFCTWYLVQTLEFRSCVAERVLSNNICTVPQAGLVLLGNPEIPALYSVHLKFGNALNEVRMNYLAEFSLSMPILSLTAVIETGGSCKDTAHVFCVQTQAIQEYFLNMSDCLLPQCDKPALVSSSCALVEAEFMKVSVGEAVEGASKRSNLTAKEMIELATGSLNPGSGFGSWVEVPNWIAATVKRNVNRVSPLTSGYDSTNAASKQFSNTSPTVDLQGDESTREEGSHLILQTRKIAPGSGTTADGHAVNSRSGVNYEVGTTIPNFMEAVKHGLSFAVKAECKEHQEQLAALPDVANPSNNLKKKRIRRRRKSLGIMVAKGKCKEHQEELDLPEVKSPSNKLKKKRTRRRKKGLGFSVVERKHTEHQEELALPHVEGSSNNLKKKSSRGRRKRTVKANRGTANLSLPKLALEDTPSLEYAMTGMSEIVLESMSDIQQNACLSPFHSGEDLSVQLAAIKESVDQMLMTQMEFQVDLSTAVEASLSYEIELIDAIQEEQIIDYFGSHLDTIWKQFVDNSSKNTLQFKRTGELQQALDEIFTKENLSVPTFTLASEVLSCVGSNVNLPICASVDKGVVTSLRHILEGWDKKLFEYVEKSLDTLLSRELQSVLTWSWKHLNQEEIFSSFWKQAVLKVEEACENMIKHSHSLSAGCIMPHLHTVEQHIDSTVLALLLSLKDTLLLVSCIAETLKEELQAVRKSTEHAPSDYSFHKGMAQLLEQGLWEDAFTMALSLGNSSVTSWICKQVDLRTLFATSPPLSQGCILLLLQQLAVDVEHDSSDKLAWMEQACLALVPNNHPNLCMRSSLEQVYMRIQRQLHLFTNVKLANQARLVMHLLNSLMTFCP